MKRLLTLALAIIPLLSMAQDDMYFTPSKKDKNTTRTPQATVSRTQATLSSVNAQVAPATIVDYKSNKRSDDEYNRRYSYNGNYQNAGGFQPGDTLVARIDTVYEYDINDNEIDYRFSRRLVRFHNPRYYALSSPYYWDLYYGYGAWDYLYDPYDPWYWHYGWGYGWSWGPWDCWYGGIWGWHHPYAWTYWGWGPGWHAGIWSYSGGHHISHLQHYRPRGEFAATPSRSGGMSSRNIQRFSASNNGASAFRGRTDKVSPAEHMAQLRGERTSVNSRGRGTYSDYAASRRGNTDGAVTQRSEGYSSRESFANRTRGGYSNINSNRSVQNNSQSSRNTYNNNNNSTSRSTYNSTPRSTYSNTNTRSTSSYNNSSSSSVSRSSSSFGGFSGSGSRSSGGSFGGGGGSFGGGGSRGGGGRR